MTVRYVSRPHYPDEDDGLNVDSSPLADLQEIVTIALREMFGARSAGNYRWVGSDSKPDGDVELSEIAITESDHKVSELMDRLPCIVVSIGGARNTGLDFVQGNVPNPLTGRYEHSDLMPANLIFKACSSVATEAMRLAEYTRTYFLIFRDFFMERAGLHDVLGPISLSPPTASTALEGSSGRSWTQVVVTVPIQVHFRIGYDYSTGSAFRRMQERVILAIERRLEGPFAIVEAGE